MVVFDRVFEAPGRFWRGNLHTHSDRSDGALTPEEVCRRYRAEGYDFIALTDHFIGQYGYPITDTTGYRDELFTTLPGAELHSGAMENGELWHILAVGLPESFTPPDVSGFFATDEQESGPALAARARATGAYVAIAHPEWSGLTTEDARTLEAAHAVEVYNHGCAVGSDRPHGFYTLDQLLSEGRSLSLCATDDAHFTEPDHFGGWVMAKAEANQPEALLEALKGGHSYSTQGPEFHEIEWLEDRVRVRTSPVSTVILSGYGSAASACHGQEMTNCEVSLARFVNSSWVRVTIVDRFERRAWANPYFVSR